jgi:hypothetical protein
VVSLGRRRGIVRSSRRAEARAGLALAAVIALATLACGGPGSDGAAGGPASETAEEGGRPAPSETTPPPPETSADATASGPASSTSETDRVGTRPVTIYTRADTGDLAVSGDVGQIVWHGSPSDRARQIVDLVLNGVPGEDGKARPPAPGLRWQEVYVDDRGIAWVDLDGRTLDVIRGSDQEQALVASLARSLVEALDEVSRIGVLVDGEPRRTLIGHVDLSRTFTGLEWPSASELADEEAETDAPDADFGGGDGEIAGESTDADARVVGDVV